MKVKALRLALFWGGWLMLDIGMMWDLSVRHMQRLDLFSILGIAATGACFGMALKDVEYAPMVETQTAARENTAGEFSAQTENRES